MTKPITKKELQDQLDGANARAAALQVRVDDVQAIVTRLQSGKVTIPELASMLNATRGNVDGWVRDGLISSRVHPDLFPRILLSDLKTFLEKRAFNKGRASVGDSEDGARARKAVAEANLAEMAVTEAAGNNPLVIKLEARIRELETEVFHLRDDSVPPPLPQPVVDILYEASNLIDGNLDEVFALLQDEADYPGFLDDLDGVVEEAKSLGILKSRIRQALDIDAEWHSKIRLQASREKLDAANASLAKILTPAF